MNIISANCLGGHIYRDLLHVKYDNPFIWTRIDSDSFIHLLENYENINFNNFVLIKESNKLENFRIIIEDKIKIQFTHHKFDKNSIKPTVKNVDVYYNKIWEYIVEKYESRIKRLSKTIDLVAVDDWSDNINVYRILEICKNKNYPLFICTNRLPEINTEKIIIKPRLIHENHGPGSGDI
jgi:uncharacterized protein (DUF1919 family)